MGFLSSLAMVMLAATPAPARGLLLGIPPGPETR